MTVISLHSRIDNPASRSRWVWNVQCDCGNVIQMDSYKLSGQKYSCGCTRRPSFDRTKPVNCKSCSTEFKPDRRDRTLCETCRAEKNTAKHLGPVDQLKIMPEETIARMMELQDKLSWNMVPKWERADLQREMNRIKAEYSE